MVSDNLYFGAWMVLLFSGGATLGNLLRLVLGKRSNVRIASSLIVLIILLVAVFVVLAYGKGRGIQGDIMHWIVYPIIGSLCFYFPQAGYAGGAIFVFMYISVSLILAPYAKAEALYHFSEEVIGHKQLAIPGTAEFNVSESDTVTIYYTDVISDAWFLGIENIIYKIERNGVVLPGAKDAPFFVDVLGGLEIYTISESEFSKIY